MAFFEDVPFAVTVLVIIATALYYIYGFVDMLRWDPFIAKVVFTGYALVAIGFYLLWSYCYNKDIPQCRLLIYNSLILLPFALVTYVFVEILSHLLQVPERQGLIGRFMLN